MAKKSDKQDLVKSESRDMLSDGLVDELRDLIQETRSGIAQTVNSALVQLYWKIGTRIRTEILKDERADYGKKIVSTLSRQLGWSHFVKNHRHRPTRKIGLGKRDWTADPKVTRATTFSGRL